MMKGLLVYLVMNPVKIIIAETVLQRSSKNGYMLLTHQPIIIVLERRDMEELVNVCLNMMDIKPGSRMRTHCCGFMVSVSCVSSLRLSVNKC